MIFVSAIPENNPKDINNVQNKAIGTSIIKFSFLKILL